jgi:hypothetical protein
MAAMNHALYLAAPFALAIGACAAQQPASAPTPAQPGLAYARIGEEVFTGGPRVTPLAVLEDSRCPAEVNCVWAGQLRLSVQIVTGKGRETRELILGKPVSVADGALLFADALPRSRQGSIPSDEYRFGFRFDGGY